MAFFRPRVSREAEVRYHADQEISKSFPEMLDKARQAERTLRDLRAATADEIELLGAGRAFDQALTEALRAAEAGQRATFGVKSYDDRIARRKAKATPAGSMWTAEVERLRTMREDNRMWGIPRLPRPVPTIV
ncbi:hypothetical protein GCM10022224_044960 [Nonomuraea antimicrobica]|uniref:Uncharacterized protein n=1 Tax=Nonomuraea antimicrobica TaxID=561173 RepID=A0ABP7C0L2_9ACTN